MSDEPRPSFYDAISEHACAVMLGRVSTLIKSPSVRQYILYKHRLSKVQSALTAFDSLNACALFAEWLEVSIGRDGLANIQPDEVMDVVDACEQLYVDPPQMEWQKPPELVPGQKPPDDSYVEDNLGYDGRQYSFLVSLVCNIFGWTSRHVLDELNIYELGIYAQEAMLLDHSDQEFQYNMSGDVGFKKAGDSWVKVQYPPLPWVKKRLHNAARGMSADKMTPIPLKYLPGGGQEVWKPGEGLVSKTDQEGEVMGLRLNQETGKVETYVIKWAASQSTPPQEDKKPPSSRGRGYGEL